MPLLKSSQPKQRRSSASSSSSNRMFKRGSRFSSSSSPDGENKSSRISFFSRRNNPSISPRSSPNTSGGWGSRAFFSKSRGNHATARRKVTDAGNAEKAADRALVQARGMVKEAQKHVKTLEREAADE